MLLIGDTPAAASHGGQPFEQQTGAPKTVGRGRFHSADADDRGRSIGIGKGGYLAALFCFAHRALCAAAIRARPSADIVRFLGDSLSAGATRPFLVG